MLDMPWRFKKTRAYPPTISKKKYQIMIFTLENIHPLLIHFPIALLSTGLFFDLLHKITKHHGLDHAGFWCLALGIISCLFANFTGLMAFLSEASFMELPKFTHSLFMWLITFLFIILFWVRIKFQLDLQYSSIKRNIYFLIHVISVVILFYAAHLGAMGEREWFL